MTKQLFLFKKKKNKKVKALQRIKFLINIDDKNYYSATKVNFYLNWFDL